MEKTLNLEITLSFLNQLRENNNKAWFDAHRRDYEAARSVFFELIDEIIDEFRIPDNLRELSAKACTARIYRDIRFSKDKSPYKTNMAALIGHGGWKGGPFGYYVSIEPGGSMVAGGLYDPSPEQLNLFRQAVDEDPDEIRQITQASDFVKEFRQIEGERLKSKPRGYEIDHPAIELLKLKQVTVIRRFVDDEVLQPGFPDRVIAACRAMKPFLDYLQRITG